MDNMLSSNEAILAAGYAGSQVLSVKLDTLGESRKKRDVRRVKRDGAASNATECKVGLPEYIYVHHR